MSVTTTPTEVKAPFDTAGFIKTYAIIGILAIFVLAATILTGGKFMQGQNLLNVVTQVAAIGIIAIGMTFVIITLGIDLSVGSVLALAAVVSTSLAQVPSATAHFPWMSFALFMPIFAGLIVGAAAGLVNGALISTFRIAPFIATLGMMSSARGAALLYSEGRPISRLEDGFNWIGQGNILGIPVPMVLLILVAVGAHVLLNYTRFGRHVYAIGGNEQAARVSGININRSTLIIYTMAGALAGLAGIISAARIGSGNPQLGTGIELDAITAAVVGGTSFKGGIGTVWGTVVGALIIQVLNTFLLLMGISDFLQMVIKGGIIILAVIIDEWKNR